MLKKIAAALGYVPLGDVQAAALDVFYDVRAYTATDDLPAWQLVLNPFRSRGIQLRSPHGLPEVAPDMRRS